MILQFQTATIALALLSLVTSGCKGDKIVGAAKDFIAFSEGQGDVVDPMSHDNSKFEVRNWNGNSSGMRYRAVVDIEVDSTLSAQKLKKLLSDAIHSPEIMRDASVVLVRAWPGKLEKFAAPMGIGIFARDGHGWDGTGVGFEKISVFQPTAYEAREKDIQALSEPEYLMVFAVESAMKRGNDLDSAQKQVAEFQSVSLEKISSACTHAARLAEWYRHRAAASGLPTTQADTK